MVHGSHKKAVLIDRIKKLQEDTQAAHEEIQELKEEVEDIVRENNALLIENQNLRARLEGLEEEEGDTMSPSKRNLERLYEDGFHVCNVSYGSRLLNDESCAFCLDVIYGKRE